MVLSINHNYTIHLIKMTLSRRGNHILWVQIQNREAAVRPLVFCATVYMCSVFLLLLCAHGLHTVYVYKYT